MEPYVRGAMLCVHSPTVRSRRVDRRRPRRRRSTLSAAGGPESVDVERSDVWETADRSRLNDPRGVGNQRLGRHNTKPPYVHVLQVGWVRRQSMVPNLSSGFVLKCEVLCPTANKSFQYPIHPD